MPNLLTVAVYPQIRAVLDTSLDAATLPDKTIESDVYVGAAWDEVIERYPTADSETNTATLNRLRRAAIYLAAARLAPAVVRITSLSVSVQGSSYSKQIFDPTKRADELRALAESELDQIDTPGELSRPTMFSYAAGTRGK
jgi:hypothetical protein